MFSKEKWKKSAANLKSTKYLALMGIFIALRVALSGIYIPVSENLRIGISYLVVAMEGIVIGPAAGLVCGFVSDLVGFMIFPSGPFFIGYTISAMLGSLVWGLFLYDEKVTVLRLIGAKVVLNYIVNVLIGSLWSAMLYSRGYIYYATASLVKNTVMLPIEVLLLYALFSLVIPLLKRRNLIRQDNTVPIPFK